MKQVIFQDVAGHELPEAEALYMAIQYIRWADADTLVLIVSAEV